MHCVHLLSWGLCDSTQRAASASVAPCLECPAVACVSCWVVGGFSLLHADAQTQGLSEDSVSSTLEVL